MEARFRPTEIVAAGVDVSMKGPARSAWDILSFPDGTLDVVRRLAPDTMDAPAGIMEQLANDATYARYLDRQQKDIEMLRRDELQEIPGSFSFEGLPGLSNELARKLDATRPKNLAQAARIEGMTPAALNLILAKLRQNARRSA